MPFAYSDGSCDFCHEGLQTSCVHGGFFGYTEGVGGAQAEAVRIPFADGTLFVLPIGQDEALMPALLTLSDVMGTGHHAAVVAKVRRGNKVAVIGDGAVGLCGVIAAKRLGAEQIIILGRHPDRIELAKAFGATDVVSERGEEAIERVKAITGALGVHSVLECVGTEQAMFTAVSITRPGGAIGRDGTCSPVFGDELQFSPMLLDRVDHEAFTDLETPLGYYTLFAIGWKRVSEGKSKSIATELDITIPQEKRPRFLMNQTYLDYVMATAIEFAKSVESTTQAVTPTRDERERCDPVKHTKARRIPPAAYWVLALIAIILWAALTFHWI